MSKYVDVEALVVTYRSHTPDDDFSKGVDFVLDLLDSKPPADVRPVVLCRDCENWTASDSYGRPNLGNYRCKCEEFSMPEQSVTLYTAPDEFCARGLRKENTP